MSSVDLMTEIQSLKAQQEETARKMAELQKLAAEQTAKEREEARKGLLERMAGKVLKLDAFAGEAKELGIGSLTLTVESVKAEDGSESCFFKVVLGSVKGLAKASGGNGTSSKTPGEREYLGHSYKLTSLGGDEYQMEKDGAVEAHFKSPTAAAMSVTGYKSIDGRAWFNLK